jgi:membrane-bound lytic murein transglycosylase A
MRAGRRAARRALACFAMSLACMPLTAIANEPAKPARASTAMRADPSQPAEARAVTHAAVTFADLPGWADDDHAAAFAAFLASCPAVKTSAATAGRTPPPPELLAACVHAEAERERRRRPLTRAEARTFFEAEFVPHRLAHAGPPGLLTGYFEPVVAGSRTKSAKFASPVYRRPPDLVNLVPDSERGAVGNELTHARATDKGPVPYATRAEIDAGALAGRGLELLYLESPVDTFFLQVQGSARVRFADGTETRIGYDGKNGHPYSSIGRHLIDSGVIAADRMSLDTLAAWLKADLPRALTLMQHNKSYVFFRELAAAKTSGPVGVLDIPLTSGRSLAVDTGHHPIGLPIYVTAPALTHAGNAAGFHRLMIAQDVGSAIRGPERGDIYFGSGAAAGKIAGVTKHPGAFFVLLPKPPAPAVGLRPTRP